MNEEYCDTNIDEFYSYEYHKIKLIIYYQDLLGKPHLWKP